MYLQTPPRQDWNRITNQQFNYFLQVATSTSESGFLTDLPQDWCMPPVDESCNLNGASEQCQAKITRTRCQVISVSCIQFSSKGSTKEPMRTFEAHITPLSTTFQLIVCLVYRYQNIIADSHIKESATVTKLQGSRSSIIKAVPGCDHRSTAPCPRETPKVGIFCRPRTD